MNSKENDFNSLVYGTIPQEQLVLCKCGASINRNDMTQSEDIEKCHPLNSGKQHDSPNLHYTKFESCPNCDRIIFADNKLILKLK